MKPADLRVLLVTGEYPPDQGGVADYTMCLADALAAQGVAVDILTTARAQSQPEADRALTAAAAEGVQSPTEADRGLETHEADAGLRAAGQPETDVPGGPGVSRDIEGGSAPPVWVHRTVSGWGWGALRAVTSAVEARRPDIVHVQYQAAAYGMRPAIHVLPSWVRRRKGVATAVTFHDLLVPYLFPKAGPLRQRAIDTLARQADLTIVTNREDREMLAGRLEVPRLALVPIGSNVRDAPPPGYDATAWRADHDIGREVALLAYFGFLNESKGARDLADALGRLAREGRDVQLVMIGGRTGASDPTNQAYLEAFEADLAERGLTAIVRWTGHVSATEVSAWFHAADVAVLPYTDGASFRRGSLLAALTHGIPVVTTEPPSYQQSSDVGFTQGDAYAAEVPTLVDGVSARLVPPTDPAALARAIGDVLDSPSLAARLSSGARALAGAFGWEAIASRHAALYRATLRQQQLPSATESVEGERGGDD